MPRRRAVPHFRVSGAVCERMKNFGPESSQGPGSFEAVRCRSSPDGTPQKRLCTPPVFSRRLDITAHCVPSPLLFAGTSTTPPTLMTTTVSLRPRTAFRHIEEDPRRHRRQVSQPRPDPHARVNSISAAIIMTTPCECRMSKPRRLGQYNRR